MAELKVIGWTNFESKCENINLSNKEMVIAVFNAVGKEIIDNNLCIAGDTHQNYQLGVPVFSNGKCLRASMRAWGTLMAHILDHNLEYMNYYMSTTSKREEKLPLNEADESLFSITGAKEIPFQTQEDMQLITQSIENNMELYTTDKIINQIYNDLKSSY